MQNKSAQQIAEEMAENIANEFCPLKDWPTYKNILYNTRLRIKQTVLSKLNLTQLIEDKMMLDWLQQQTHLVISTFLPANTDCFGVAVGDESGLDQFHYNIKIRQAIKSAMKKEQDK